MSLHDEIKRIDQQISEHESLLKDPELSSLAKEEIAVLKIQKKALTDAIESMNGNGSNDSPMSMDSKNALCVCIPGFYLQKS